MKVIGHGSRYEIYKDDLKTYDGLPAGTYYVRFAKMSGFFLEQVSDFIQKEPKVYGTSESKIAKVFRTYKTMDRSLGVLMSGDKGIGKSLFAQLLCAKAIEQGMPVVVVDTPYVGVTNFLQSIQQDILVLFDEFEKVFPARGSDSDGETQEDFLSLFDGLSQQKRMYVLTINNINNLNTYFVNRAGRIHYHFRFGYPTGEEIRKYLEDKVTSEYHGEIDAVVAFSAKVKLNYDSLRAIAIELEQGYSFEESIADLNITNVESNYYDVTVTFTAGEPPITITDEALDLFGTHERIVTYTDYGRMEIKFNPRNLILTPEGFQLSESSAEIITRPRDEGPYVKSKIQRVLITQTKDQALHYTL